MGRPFAVGKKAIGYCDRCGFQYLLKELRSEVVNMEETDVKACPECWDPDNPQTQLGRHYFSEAQALRNPRPVGGTSGRKLPYAYRWDFENPTILTNPERFDGWWVSNGILSYVSGNDYLTLAADEDSVNVGDPWMQIGYNGSTDPVWLDPGIDCSIYKHINIVIRVDRFPTGDNNDSLPRDFQGDIFFVLDNTTGAGVYPYSVDRFVRASNSSLIFVNAQAADGFSTDDRDMATYFKISWDMSSSPNWVGQCYGFRFDIFDTRKADVAHNENESIQIHSISVDAYYNPNI
jgi:hypothetical protein